MMDMYEAEVDEFEDVPDGNYIVTIEKMELTMTKETKKPMFAVQCKVSEDLQGKGNEGRLIFFNRVIGGNVSSDKWNDGKAIKSVITWLEKLETETVPEFFNYSDFKRIIDLIFAKTGGKLFKIDYHPYLLNPVKVCGRAS